MNVAVSNLNNLALAARYLPLDRDGLIDPKNPFAAMLAALLNLPVIWRYAALAKIRKNKKEVAVAYLINKNKDKIIAKIEDLLLKQDVRVRLGELKVEV